jgi:hypothetical protein
MGGACHWAARPARRAGRYMVRQVGWAVHTKDTREAVVRVDSRTRVAWTARCPAPEVSQAVARRRALRRMSQTRQDPPLGPAPMGVPTRAWAPGSPEVSRASRRPAERRVPPRAPAGFPARRWSRRRLGARRSGRSRRSPRSHQSHNLDRASPRPSRSPHVSARELWIGRVCVRGDDSVPRLVYTSACPPASPVQLYAMSA